jgi:hypothetical protein
MTTRYVFAGTPEGVHYELDDFWSRYALRYEVGSSELELFVKRYGTRIAGPRRPSADRAYELLGLLRQEVRWLDNLDEDGARQVMGEVSTFETDWWGGHGR